MLLPLSVYTTAVFYKLIALVISKKRKNGLTRGRISSSCVVLWDRQGVGVKTSAIDLVERGAAPP